jgi:hypothetical protein
MRTEWARAITGKRRNSMAKKRGRSVLLEIIDYYLQIESWNPQIGLGVDHNRVWQRPYWEQYGVKIQGRMLAPQSVRMFPLPIT